MDDTHFNQKIFNLKYGLFSEDDREKKNYLITIALIFVLFQKIQASNLSTPLKKTPPLDLRLYTLNCGYFKIHDATPFFNKDFYPHQSLVLADPCYLIKHNDIWMLWDLGLDDKHAGKPIEDKKHGISIYVNLQLKEQLKK